MAANVDIFPGDPNRVAVVASNYMDWSGGGIGERPDLQTGVFLSSDGGNTFTKLTTEIVNARYVEFHSTDPDKFYVGIPQNGIFELEVE